MVLCYKRLMDLWYDTNNSLKQAMTFRKVSLEQDQSLDMTTFLRAGKLEDQEDPPLTIIPL